MFRKLTIALAATAALGAAALAPTAASAGGGGWHPKHHWHGHHGWNGGFGIGFGPTFVSGPDCYVVKRLVERPMARAGAASRSATKRIGRCPVDSPGFAQRGAGAFAFGARVWGQIPRHQSFTGRANAICPPPSNWPNPVHSLKHVPPLSSSRVRR